MKENIIEKIKSNKDKIIFVVLLIIITLFSCAPILNNVNIWGHDLSFHIARINGIAEGLRNGEFPAIINTTINSDEIGDMGYGSALFYPDIFLYIPALLNIIGMDLILAYKAFLVLITMCTYIVMYFTIKKIFKSKEMATVGSILYTLSLYRIEDVFVRAALGEVLSFIFFPLIILGLYEAIYGNKKKWYYIAIGLFGIANSHMISFLFAAFIIVFVMLLNAKKLFKEKDRFWELVFCGVVSVWICASVFFPMFEQIGHQAYRVSVGATGLNLHGDAATLTKVFENKLHPGQSSNTDVKITNSMNMGVGTVLLIVPICIIFCKNKDENKKFVYQLFILGILGVIMTTKFFPWQLFQKQLSNIQFAWRFNMIATLGLSIVAAYVIYHISDYKKEVCIFSMVLYLIFSGMQLENSIVYKEDWTIDDLLNELPLGAREYLPVNYEVTSDLTSEDGVFEYKYNRKGSQIEFLYSSANKNGTGKVKVPLTYYTGYAAKITKNDGTQENLKVTPSETGTVLVDNSNQLYGTIRVYYKGTIIQAVSRIITLVTWGALVYYIIKLNRRH